MARFRNKFGMTWRGFTLAEVLITLGIIGIVAALTLPNLITTYKEKEAVSKLKKVYATFGNAYTLAANEHGSPDNWYTNETFGSLTAANRLISGELILSRFL